MTTKKRNLFEELKQGIHDIQAYQAGKLTLRTQKIEDKNKENDQFEGSE